LNISGSAISIPYRPNRLSLEDQLCYWLKRIYLNIIIFLESDNWVEEINKSTKSITPALEKLKTVSIKTKLVKLNLLMKEIPNKVAEKQSVSTVNNSKSDNSTQRYYQIFNKQLKGVYNSLFPAINRFI